MRLLAKIFSPLMRRADVRELPIEPDDLPFLQRAAAVAGRLERLQIARKDLYARQFADEALEDLDDHLHAREPDRQAVRHACVSLAGGALAIERMGRVERTEDDR